ncbi:Retrotransposable element Tf2 [Gossypium australe]|uniref:Retrotransposable element Tf2 n=1 Tax=Gossypium australe TaxID=47621 RepID=A0A5B6WZP4_9ROSI|nr:Retrotransposable element Tf2 [Gossypium australe]
MEAIYLIMKQKKKILIIQDCLKTALDRRKSYVDLKEKTLSFKLATRKRKLNPRLIGPYEILERKRTIAYRLAILPELEKIYKIFHVSMLRRYRSDLSHVISPDGIELQPNLTYSEKPVKIFAQEGGSSESVMKSSRYRRGYMGAGQNYEIPIALSFLK